MTSSWTKTVFIYTDGASRGNPGPSALGLQVFNSEKKLIYEEGVCLKQGTNNFAEYSAVVYALELAVKHEVQELHLFSDSELLVRQLEGKYRVKSPNIKPLFQKCLTLIKSIPKAHFQHIPREKNAAADRLANQALDLNT
ncbi:MAG: ribonuclease HI family protein [Bdellovibrionales bacterium]|nr:ribonuclease HI family protein [Bdellovibrionales bacterium]